MEREIHTASSQEAHALYGSQDRHLKLIRDALGVQVIAQGEVVQLRGDRLAVDKAVAVLEKLLALIQEGSPVPDDLVERLVNRKAGKENRAGNSVMSIAKSPGQVRYLEAMSKHDLVFSIGPAGSGKTFLAVTMAVEALRAGEYRKLVLTRPAVEAGERLGFLPGDYHAKIHPYLRPLYDALNESLDYEQFKRYMEREIIEVIPLAYMRGRTLSHSYIILDEAQNTTPEQMKMFLTRMGLGSKIVVTGDITQIDLPSDQCSGLVQASSVLRHVPGVAWITLSRQDIVRHPLVKHIVEAYERPEVAD